MSEINYAYTETETPIQNGRHQTSGSTPENTYENGNANHHEYAKPSTPPTNQRNACNEYASPVHNYSNGDMGQVKPKKRVSYSLPEPDYEPARRESYVEMVTKL